MAAGIAAWLQIQLVGFLREVKWGMVITTRFTPTMFRLHGCYTDCTAIPRTQPHTLTTRSLSGFSFSVRSTRWRFFAAVTMLMITKKISGCILTLLFTALLLGLSPWKIIPYTDGSSIVFPIAAFFLYTVFTKMKSRWKEPLREFYWQDGENYDWFVTISHGLWLILLVGIILEAAVMLWQSGCELLKNEKGKTEDDARKQTAVGMAETLYFIGLFLFLMLFEGRARYLYNGVAVFTLMAMTGYCKTFELLANLLGRILRKERKNAYNFS